MMNPDPNRQWFVYFNEKELGPFTETELHSKLTSGEFDQNAYVFTEGMTDWALVSDTPVLLSGGPKVSAPPATQWSETPSQSTKSKVMNLEAENPFADLLGSSSGDAPKAAQPPAQTSAPSQDESAFSISAPTNASKGFGLDQKTAGTQPGAQPEAPAPATYSAPISQAKSTPSASSSAGASLSRPLSGASSVKVGSEPTLKGSAFGASSSIPVPSGNPARKRVLLYLLLVIVMIGAGLYWVQNNGGLASIPYVSSLLKLAPEPKKAPPPPPADENAAEPEALADDSVAATDPNAPAPAPKAPKAAKAGSLSDGDWKVLFNFRTQKDQKGPPYTLAAAPLGDRYPIIVGALSPLIQVEKVYVAAFPDSERSLFAVPRIWYLEASVIDGVFSIGPLNNEGKELPAGRYKVLVQTSEAYLGDTSFNTGTWPTGTKLTEINAVIANEAKTLATKEREALDLKLKEVKAALMQLKSKSMTATKGPRAYKAWKEFSKPWYESLAKAIKEQRAITQGPMFYPDTQLKILNYMENVRTLEESYELLSQGGAKLLAKSRKKNLSSQLADIAKGEMIIGTDIGSLDKVEVKPLQVSLENVKKGLEYFMSTGGNASK